ncbi:LLM class flavin-dependent oxidoreductase [Pseudonocardia lacus]|uniref:LLM class flavin-dependent oxidoreductase n=1 Tax=Pseudonocardia lacus TaxID=2835865 RepID=UPI001BDC349B|nr:LLM class flavin-dependent oxidoreductase [Pseudonocardia lacus]
MELPDPALVVLVGPAGAGKSTWAASRYREVEVVSSDALRERVGTGPADLDATTEAFAVLEAVVAARLRRGLTTVVDTLGLDPRRRRDWLAAGRATGLPCVAVVFDTPGALCRARNRQRDRPVPAPALTAQLRRMPEVSAEVAAEGWDVVVRERGGPAPAAAAPAPAAAPAGARPLFAEPGRLSFVLQVSRFPWGDDPAAWLRAVAVAAEGAGFAGLALMDHLIQIPQVGRPFEAIPDPLVALGLLAGATTTLHLGTLVSPVTVRPAGPLAKALATLDALSDGRAFCGLGAGWWEREHAAHALAFPSPRERLDLLERAVPTLRALWAPGTGPAAGLPETTCYPRPVGALPIIIGGTGRRTLRIAATAGDACNVPADRVADVGEQNRITVLDLPLLGDDREHVARLVERLRGRTGAAAFAARHHAGTAAEHVRRYRLLAETGVRTAFVSPPDLAGPDDVARWAPVTAALA